MSSIDAYYVTTATISAAIGSKDAALKKQVLADPQGLIRAHKDRYDDKPLVDAIEEIIQGNMGDFFEFGYNTTLAFWPVIAALATERPANPTIADVGFGLDDLATELEEAELFPLLTKLFWSLMAYDENPFALKLKKYPSLADRPSLVALSPTVLKKLSGEAEMRQSLVAAPEPAKPTKAAKAPKAPKVPKWRREIGDHSAALLQLFAWLDEASSKKHELILVLDGPS
jgi:hypothetical protein